MYAPDTELMEEMNMFNNIGRKIKKLAKTLCWIGIALSGIFAIIMFVTASQAYGSELGTCVFLGFLFLIGGTLFSWLSSLFTYGFGELIEKACIIAENTAPKKEDTQPQYSPVERFINGK